MFRIMKWIMRIVAVLLVVGSLSLTASVLMFSSVAFLVSNAIEAVSGAKTIYSTLTTKVKVQEGKITTLSNNLADKNKKLKLANSKIAKQSYEIRLTNTKLRIAKNTIKNRSDSIAELGIKITNLETRATKNIDHLKIKKITDSIFKRTKNRAVRNVSGLTIQSVPYVGVSAIVGLTILELNDSCNTAIDLQKIEQYLPLPKEDESVVTKICNLKEEYLNLAKEFIPDLPDLPDLNLLDLDLSDWETTKEWLDWITSEPDN